MDNFSFVINKNLNNNISVWDWAKRIISSENLQYFSLMCVVGENIINSTGALHHLTKNKIESAPRLFEVPSNKKIVAVILGGENNHYYLTRLLV